jgi:CubicO group peptidase (beta-lactamase class C family)
MDARLDGFSDFLARSTQAWRIPGVAVGVVKGGRVLATFTYGVRDITSRKPVTERTLFEIGSITKSFTASALGMLVDEGKVAWDTPVRDYLPAFAMHDPAVSDQVTLRDLLSHRTGLPRHDSAHFGSTASREELTMRVRHLPLNAPFRTTFQYTNIQYVVAGWVLEQIAGASWEELIRTRLFAPLGMTHSTFLTEELPAGTDAARGHYCYPLPVRYGLPTRQALISAGPAGSIMADVRDACRWLSFQMTDGKGLLSPATLKALHTPVIVRQAWSEPEVVNPTYGMGWMQMGYRGQLWVGHTGSTSGFCAHLSWLPREKVGVVVLTNGSSDLLPWVLAFNLYDRLLSLPPVPWFTRMRRESGKRKKSLKETEAKQSKEPIVPTPELAAFSGTYRHPGYSHLIVRAMEAAILVDYHTLTYRLFAKEEGLEIVSDHNRRIPATFAYGADGTATLALTLEPATAPIVFTREEAGS